MHRFCLLFLLTIVACNDPASDIGSDLLGAGLEPAVYPVAPSVFAAVPFADITGQALRVLSGSVEDPLLGSVTAVGHMDFESGFAGTAPQITGAALRLRRSYVYGDTTSMLTVAVHDIVESWEAPGVKADSALMLGPEVTTHTFLSIDTVVVIPMPDTWVSTYEDTLRSSEFNTLFHGLALAPVDGQAVVGFVHEGTSLQLHSANDTTDFPFDQSFTALTRQLEPVTPEGRVATQDGAGPGVRIEFDLKELANKPTNGAVFVIHADTLTMQEAPENFVRPTIEELQLVAVRDDDQPALLVAQTRITEEGIFSFSGSDMGAFFHRVLFGHEEFQHLELRVPVLGNGINGLLLYDGTSEDAAPELRIILGA